MNKFLIVLLAICLVSVHAYVKRDAPAAPAPTENKYLEDLQKQFQDLTSKVKDNFESTLNPDEIKKNIDQFMNSVSQLFQDKEKKA